MAPFLSSAGICVMDLSAVPGFHTPGLSIFNPSYVKLVGGFKCEATNLLLLI